MESDTESKLLEWIKENADDFWVPRMLEKVERPEQLAIIAVGIAFHRMLTEEDPRTYGVMLKQIQSFGVERGLIRAVARTLIDESIEAGKWKGAGKELA